MITTIEDLKKVSTVKEVDLPPFVDGTPFKAKIKRAGLIDMMYNGKIANPLLDIAFKLTDGSGTDDKTIKKATAEEKLESLKFMMSIVENCLIEPSYKDIKDCGIDLTDEQIIAIHSYALQGIEHAKKFCESP